MVSDLSVRMIMLEARFGIKGKPGRSLGGEGHTVQGRSHGNGELSCDQEREETFGNGGKGMSGRGY